jgi:Flp pilus assembly protein CpaB
MKTKLIIAAATVAGAVLISYLLKKSKSEDAEQTPQPFSAKNNHHLTNVFAQAKHHMD